MVRLVIWYTIVPIMTSLWWRYDERHSSMRATYGRAFYQFKKRPIFYLSHSPAVSLQWRHNERDVVSNHRRLDCLLKRLFRCRLNKTSKLRVTGLCERNSPVTGEFPTQRSSNAENVPIWWRHHVHYRVILLHLYSPSWHVRIIRISIS